MMDITSYSSYQLSRTMFLQPVCTCGEDVPLGFPCRTDRQELLHDVPRRLGEVCVRGLPKLSHFGEKPEITHDFVFCSQVFVVCRHASTAPALGSGSILSRSGYLASSLFSSATTDHLAECLKCGHAIGQLLFACFDVGLVK